MIILYTAVGKCIMKQKNGEQYLVVINHQKEHYLDIYEEILWSALNHNIYTYDELEEIFYETERELHLIGELDFDYYLERLLCRGIIASAMDYTGINALYRILGRLYIKPTGSMLHSFILLLQSALQKRIPIKYLFGIEEMRALKLIRQNQVSTAELIKCIDKNVTNIRTHNKLLDCLIDDGITDYKNIVRTSVFLEEQISVLKVVSNLYFKKHIHFEILI